MVWSHSSHLAALAQNNVPGSSLIKREKTKIGNRCFIVGPSVILPGVTIGNQVIVRPMTRVEQDIPDRSIVDASGIKEGVLSEERIQDMLEKHFA
nr:hypothetical protein [Desulfobotulus pelophilus]